MYFLCAQWIANDLSFHVDCKDWSDWADNQADLCQAHKSIVSFVMLRLKYIKVT